MKKVSVQKQVSPIIKQPSVTVDKLKKLRYFSRFLIPQVFFSCFFLFIVLYINPPVILSNNGINTHSYVTAMQADDSTIYKDPWFRNIFILELTPRYFHEIVTTPGGWTKFAVTLCIYSCHDAFLGAFVITGIALLFFWIFALYIKGTGAKRLYYVHYAPAIFILTFCTWYELRPLATIIPVAGALVMALLYRDLKSLSFLHRAVLLSLYFWFTWYLTQWGCLLFLIFILIDAFWTKQRKSASTFAVAVINIVIFIIIEKHILPLDKVIRWGDLIVYSSLIPVMTSFFPTAAIIVALVNRYSKKHEHDSKQKYTEIIEISLFACIITASAFWLYKNPVNRNTRTIARTVHYIINGKWNVILHEKIDHLFSQFPQKAGPLQLFMIHATNQAIFRTGQAGEKLFSYPQASFNYDPLLMLESTHASGVVNWVAVLELTMDLGMINSAEKIAGELMETAGSYPEFLYRRALVQIARENPEAAMIYLNKLSNMPFYRREAKRLLLALHDKNVLLSTPRLAGMYAHRDTIDYFLFNRVSPDEQLRNLLQSNPGNRLAYDYLVSYSLLTGQIGNISVYLQFAPSFGYSSLPRYWEEALCMNIAVQAQQSLSDVSFSGLRPETVNRFHSFTQSWLQMEHDPDAAVKLLPSYGDTYFYYSIFRHSRGAFR